MVKMLLIQQFPFYRLPALTFFHPLLQGFQIHIHTVLQGCGKYLVHIVRPPKGFPDIYIVIFQGCK